MKQRDWVADGSVTLAAEEISDFCSCDEDLDDSKRVINLTLQVRNAFELYKDAVRTAL